MADVPDGVQNQLEFGGTNFITEGEVLVQEVLTAQAAPNELDAFQFPAADVVEEEGEAEDSDSESDMSSGSGTNPHDIADGIAIPREGETYNLPDLFGNSPFYTQHRHRCRPSRGHQGRIFKEVDVGNFVVQTKNARFPPKEGVPPRPASWRSNLAALSQKHNLYFAAIMDKLYITVPRGLKHTIAGTPDILLDLPITSVGRTLPSHFVSAKPHAVNHLKVGNLGQLEVIVMTCDDGDVLVYYSHLLQREVENLAQGKKDMGVIEP